ncbi:sorting nexin-11 [Trichonephila clavata]|uniref:Sorting nexin-11 n=1 Tax=Trichonephila clavata TaxID=2740835 RepID=A0A8X6FJ90_TRICU|nr:sorting nexin-11 [Trichonephila clavata]
MFVSSLNSVINNYCSSDVAQVTICVYVARSVEFYMLQSVMLEIASEDDSHQFFIKIKVESKIEPYASYVNYAINIETNNPSFTFEKSTTRRRYSEFRMLHSMLAKQFSNSKIPVLPSKSPFKKAFDLEFVEKRRAALEEFLAKLLSKKLYLSSRAFHLFLQSSCPMSEIKDIVEGKTSHIDPHWPGIVKQRVLPLKDETNALVSNQESNCPSDESVAFCSSSSGNKRVSFCDQVTVAEIHSAL